MSTNAPPPAAQTSQPPPSADSPKVKQIHLGVAVGESEISVSEDEKTADIPNLNGRPDIRALQTALADWRLRFPGRIDVTLKASNRAPYKYLVVVMDTLIKENFSDVGIDLN